MVVKLANHDDKTLIFQNTQKLKGTNFFVTEQLPEELAENKKQAMRLKGQNKRLPVEEQLQINVKKDKVFVNNERYKPAVVAPTALTWLKKDENEQKEIKRVQVVRGMTDNSTTSTFISYVARVHSTDEVQKAYYRVFLKEPRATHIVCSYILPGPNFPRQQGAIDDREFGAARQMLRKMQEANAMNCAVFIARYYGGTHLGTDRFKIYKELTATALQNLEPQQPKRLNVEQLLGSQGQTQSGTFTFQPPDCPSFFTTPIVPVQQRLQDLAGGNATVAN